MQITLYDLDQETKTFLSGVPDHIAQSIPLVERERGVDGIYLYADTHIQRLDGSSVFAEVLVEEDSTIISLLENLHDQFVSYRKRHLN